MLHWQAIKIPPCCFIKDIRYRISNITGWRNSFFTVPPITEHQISWRNPQVTDLNALTLQWVKNSCKERRFHETAI